MSLIKHDAVSTLVGNEGEPGFAPTVIVAPVPMSASARDVMNRNAAQGNGRFLGSNDAYSNTISSQAALPGNQGGSYRF